MNPPPHERGAALLAVLLLVAVMGALAASALERLRLSTALAINHAALDQARAFAVGVEQLMALTIDDLTALSPEITTNAGGWNAATRTIPMPGGGLARATVRDGGNCFNINSVAEGRTPLDLKPRLSGVQQFAGLMRALQVPEAQAQQIAEAAADWVDSDPDRSRNGAEDSDYARAAQAYRVGNTLFAEPSELRALAGMTPDLYARLRPFVCALPTTDLSPINVNTLVLEQAPLIAMLEPSQITLDRAQRVIASRPTAGWSQLADFYLTPELQFVRLPVDVQSQPQLRTRWFKLDLQVELQGAALTETALVDARIAPARVVVRRWGNDD
jgi:general secretion pathway protein K